MRSKLGDKARLNHILTSIHEIESYCVNSDIEAFINNSMMRFACIKQLEIIGEAANHISEGIKNQFTSIEWPQIVGMRNIFVHEYFGIDTKILWDIIKKDLPDLKANISSIVNTL
jgi:uncharacterized protein with HEPN domain